MSTWHSWALPVWILGAPFLLILLEAMRAKAGRH